MEGARRLRRRAEWLAAILALLSAPTLWALFQQLDSATVSPVSRPAARAISLPRTPEPASSLGCDDPRVLVDRTHALPAGYAPEDLVSLRALGAWDLLHLEALWRSTLEATGDERAAVAAVHDLIDADLAAQASVVAENQRLRAEWDAEGGTQGERARRRADTEHAGAAGGMGQRRVLIHPSGFVQSPYTDVAPAGESPRSVPRKFADPGRKLWHSSPGSSGR